MIGIERLGLVAGILFIYYHIWIRLYPVIVKDLGDDFGTKIACTVISAFIEILIFVASFIVISVMYWIGQGFFQ